MSDWKYIAALHGLLGEAIGIIEGTSMRDDVGEDFRRDLAAIADRLREQSQGLCREELSEGQP